MAMSFPIGDAVREGIQMSRMQITGISGARSDYFAVVVNFVAAVRK